MLIYFRDAVCVWDLESKEDARSIYQGRIQENIDIRIEEM